MADLGKFNSKTLEEIRDSALTTYRNALIQRGISNPNTSFGTEIYVKFTAIAQQLAVLSNNISIFRDSVLATTAQGVDLENIASIYGLSLKPAGGSIGFIVLTTTVVVPVLIPVSAQLTDEAGLTYEVTIGGAYSDGDSIPIKSIDTGEVTNLGEDAVLRWSSAPPFVTPTALIDIGGLDGGADAEDYEDLRARLLEKFANSTGGGNWAQVNSTAEKSSKTVQKAFCYPACNGPATVGVAVVGAASKTNKNRDISALTLATTISPSIIAEFPLFAEFIITTVQNLPVDVSIGLSLPNSPQAASPGPGGGWINGVPWPTYSVTDFSQVSSVTGSAKTFTLLADVAPIAGLTEICWVSTDDWKLRTAIVISYTGAGPTWTVTLDKPFTSDNGVPIAVGDYVFPNASKMSTYVDTLLDQFAKLGPGQKTDQAGVLPRAYRRPLTSDSWVSDLGPSVLKFIVLVGDEVLDASYLAVTLSSPPVPTLITDAPYILVPRKISFTPLT